MLFEHATAKLISALIVIASLLATFTAFIYSLLTIPDQTLRSTFQQNVLPFTALPAGIIIGSYILHILPKASDIVEVQLETLRKERIEITTKIEEESKLDIFHTIQLSLNQLSEYYTINKGQARISFRMSILAIVVGLVTIMIGIWLLYSGNKNVTMAYISAGAGTILEFIGGAYFFMYKKSLDQVNLFFGQLIKVQDTMLAINLANDVTNEEKKGEMNEKIIVSLLERSLK